MDAVLNVAQQVSRAPAEVATAWVNHRATRLSTPAVPIIGPRNVAQLDDYLAALELTLSPAQIELLDQVSAPSLGIPHEANAQSLDGLQGGAAARVDAPVVPIA